MMNHPRLASAGEIARTLGRSRFGVKKAIERMGIQPVHRSTRIALYDEAPTTAAVRESMRAHNKATSAATTHV